MPPSNESQTQSLGNLIRKTEEETKYWLSLKLKELSQNEETGRDEVKETAEEANQDKAAVDLHAASDAHSGQEQTRMTELCETTLQR